MKTVFLLTLAFVLSTPLIAQSPEQRSLSIDIPIIDLPQYSRLPYRAPSMNQALHISNDLYDLGFYGINKANQKLFPKRKAIRNISNYAAGLAFSYYGSELPIPLGVWAHEEFHRSVLGVNKLYPKNGNWLFTRWDGTVFGITDDQLSGLNRNAPQDLLYSYVAGIQYETLATQDNVVNDFFNHRTQYKSAMYLSNAWYVFNYFRFSTSALSDSVKIKAPGFESANPAERDFAGADLTAWAYDMFTANEPYTAGRSPFPNGEGVNRRIGYSDLTVEAQQFLNKQMRLALINFINPAIFFVNRINVGERFSFNLFGSYQPTHFGNAISITVPMRITDRNVLLIVNQYSNKNLTTHGFELGLFNKKIGVVTTDTRLSVWSQPQDQLYNDLKSKPGGSIQFTARVPITRTLQVYTTLSAKNSGWIAGDPFLDENVSIRAGLRWKPLRKMVQNKNGLQTRVLHTHKADRTLGQIQGTSIGKQVKRSR